MMHYHVALLNEFDLRTEYSQRLHSYFLLHWQFTYLIRKLNDDGTLTKDGVTYIPVWPTDFSSIGMTAQVKLSFRQQTEDERGAYNYVLIRTK